MTAVRIHVDRERRHVTEAAAIWAAGTAARDGAATIAPPLRARRDLPDLDDLW